ncbi:glycosyltransferase 87 family protein [Streptomyces sp. NPDC057428]|uniref:glycosyltransferase 87 family protein n=1 Tax=Streptomyces sp. NPDC057428 TaxID=3346129 RepID=UPI0036CED70A
MTVRTGTSGRLGRGLSLAVWGLTRAVLLLCVFKVFTVPGPDVTSDVSAIYRGWYEVFRAGSYPLDDVTWQYPPAAALAVLSPDLFPFLDYACAFFVLVLLCDALVLGLLLRAAGRPGGGSAGVWLWVLGVPLLGPTVYARYDLMVTAVAVAALLAGVRHPRALGALAAFGTLLKVWPVLLLAGTAPGRATRRSWSAAAVTAGVLLLVAAVALPGAFVFLTFQRDRGLEIESLGALFFHVARQFGWSGRVELRYGSMEFAGPQVALVSTLALALSVFAFGWLLVWRLRARTFSVHTPADAAFTAVLLFTVTSRVISPQYMVWPLGVAAVCLVFRGSRMGLPAGLVLVATGVTLLEFPLGFAHVVASDAEGVALMAVRNGLLVVAALCAGHRLWRETVPGARRGRTAVGPFSPAGREDTPASAP